MTNNGDYKKDMEKLRDDAVSNLEKLIESAKSMAASGNVKSYIKVKTQLRYNTLSALLQRAQSIAELARVNQGNVANIVVRSMWETLIEYEFVNLTTSNKNIYIRLANESKQQLATLKDVKRLRSKYPNANTWEEQISNKSLDQAITRRQNDLKAFDNKYPGVNSSLSKSLLSRAKAIDDHYMSKNPNLKTLTQIDYRLLFSTLSHDTHSTILGNADNSRMIKSGLEMRVDSPPHEGPRAAHLAFTYLLSFLQDLNHKHKLRKGDELRKLRKIEKEQNDDYRRLQRNYNNAF